MGATYVAKNSVKSIGEMLAHKTYSSEMVALIESNSGYQSIKTVKTVKTNHMKTASIIQIKSIRDVSILQIRLTNQTMDLIPQIEQVFS